MSFGKTQKLHRAIDHRLAGVTWQAHFALDGVTKGDTAVQSGHGDDGENKEVDKTSHEEAGGGGAGGGWGVRTLRPTAHCCAQPEERSEGEEAGLKHERGREWEHSEHLIGA